MNTCWECNVSMGSDCDGLMSAMDNSGSGEESGGGVAIIFKNNNNNNNASTSVGAAAYAAELRKHVANDTRCQELGWTCIPLAVETYGNWGMEAQSVFSRLASLLAIGQAIPKPKMLGDIYGHLNMSLVRSVARAIMGRENVRIG